MNMTDPRVIKTLRRIDDALLENLDKYQFQKITVEMICSSAKINRSTFYKYYKDKSDLLDSFLKRILDEFSNITSATGFILATPYTVSEKDYIKHFRETIDYIYDHRFVYRILWHAGIGRAIYQEMEDIICSNILKTIQNNSSVPPEISPYHELYARLFASNFMTLMRWWLKNEPSISRSDVESVMEGNIKSTLFTTTSKKG